MLLNLKTSFIPGPAGELEILPVEIQHANVTAVICHPHPLQGGNMTNKVVTVLARVFNECGCNTIRFNFRGVGKSTGEYDEGRGEFQDLLAVVEWARKSFQAQTVWLSGFSFGGWIAMQGALQLFPQKLITVAPMFSRLKYEPVNHLKSEWIFIQGEKDELVDVNEVFQWLESLKNPPILLRFPETSHFFHGKLGLLRDELIKILKKED